MRTLSALLFTLAVACGGATGSTDKVDQAVPIARELRASPADAEKILADHALTLDQWEAIMFDIAGDPALAARYETALAK